MNNTRYYGGGYTFLSRTERRQGTRLVSKTSERRSEA